MQRRAPLRRKTGLKQGGALKRVGQALRRTPLGANPPRRDDPAQVQAFFDAVLTVPAPPDATGARRVRARCAVCGKRAVDPHHVLAKQHLRRYEKKMGVPVGSLVWDPDNGLPLCRGCHDNHETGHRRIPRDVAMTPKVCMFAWAIDMAIGTGEATMRLEAAYPE
jgi:hypothetical protein